MPPISCITSSGVSDSLFSTAYTLGSLLWAAIARVKGTVFDRPSVFSSRPFPTEASMSRTPIDQIAKDDSKIAFRRRKSTKNSTYSMSNQSLPQRLFKDSIPKVHHTLPDARLWNEIDENLLLQEKSKRRNATDFSTTDLKLGINFPSKLRLIKNSNSYKNYYFSKTRSRRKRNVRLSQSYQGVFRRRQLYCRTGYHLQMLPNGKVTGTEKDHDVYAIVDFISAGFGYVSIRGVKSGQYLTMDHRGRLYGSDIKTKNSVFKEDLQENWFNTYSTTRTRHRTRQCYITINKRGRWRPGCRSNSHQRLTHFLPRPVDPEKVPELYKGILY